ncbi:hypothetical protein AOLI_G00090460 [Acnodon oligacanthus]
MDFTSLEFWHSMLLG